MKKLTKTRKSSTHLTEAEQRESRIASLMRFFSKTARTIVTVGLVGGAFFLGIFAGGTSNWSGSTVCAEESAHYIIDATTANADRDIDGSIIVYEPGDPDVPTDPSITASGSLDVTGLTELGMQYKNLDSMTLSDGITLANTGTIDNVGLVDVTGTFTNSGTMEHVINLDSTGRVTNNSDMTLTGSLKSTDVTNSAGSTLSAGNIQVFKGTYTASLSNSGTIQAVNIITENITNNATGYVLTDNLDVYNQVTNSGTLIASGNVGSFNLTNNGTMEADNVSSYATEGANAYETGTINNTGTLNITGTATTVDLTNEGKLIAGDINAISLNTGTKGSINNTNELTASGNVTTTTVTNAADAKLNANNLTATTSVTNDGDINVTGKLSTATLTNNAGTDDVHNTITAGDINATTVTNADNADINANNLTATTSVENDGNISVTGKLSTATLTNNAGTDDVHNTITAGDINATTVTNADNADLTATNVTATDSVTNDGDMKVAGIIDTATLANNGTGTMTAGDINATSVTNATEADLTANNVSATTSVTNNGDMNVAGKLNSATLLNQAGTLTAGDINATATVTNAANANLTANNMTATTSVTNNGTINVAGKIGTATLDNQAGILTADNINATTVTNAADLTANNVTATTSVTNTGDMKVAGKIGTATLDNQAGTLTAGDINATTVTNADNADINATNVTAINDAGDATVSNSGTMSVAGKIDANFLKNEIGSDEKHNIITAGNINVTNQVINSHNADLTANNITAKRVEGDGRVTNSGTMNVAGKIDTDIMSNFGDPGTNLTAGDINATNTVSNFSELTANNITAGNRVSNLGNMKVAGTIETKGFVSNQDEGTLTADNINATSVVNTTGANLNATNLTATDSVTNNGTFTSTANVSTDTLTNTGSMTVDNLSATTSITNGNEEGVEATLNAKGLVQTGTLTNNSNANIHAFDNVVVEGDASNTGTITLNQKMTVKGTLTNNENATVQGEGNGAVLDSQAGLENNGQINNIADITAGTTNNNATGTITSTGAGSTMTVNGNLGNAGQINDVERMDVKSAAVVDGDTTPGNLENTGSIKSTGNGSVYNIAGALSNHGDGTETGLIENVANIRVRGGDLTNSGTISTFRGDNGTLNVSNGNLFNGRNAEGTVDPATISGYKEMNVAGTAENTQGSTIEGSGKGSVYTIDGTLTNDGTIKKVEKLEAGTTTNSATGTITSTGAGSTMVVNGNLTNAGQINDVEKMNVKAVEVDGETTPGNLANTGSITASGKGSVYTIDGELTNDGTIEKIEKLEAGTTENNGTITSTGAGSTMVVNGNLDNAGEINDVEKMDVKAVEGVVDSGNLANTGSINGTGDGSIYNIAGNLTNFIGGNENSGNINNVARIGIMGNLTNGGNIVVNAGDDGAINVGGNLINGQDADENVVAANIRGYKEMNVAGTAENTQGSTIEGSGKGSVYTIDGTLNNDGTIEKVEKLEAGTTTNSATGIITSTGAGSTMVVNGNLNNAGEINDVEKMNVKSATVVDGDTTPGDLANTGIINGTGDGSIYNIAGNLTNYIGVNENSGNINNVARIGVEGNLTNGGNITMFNGDDGAINVGGNLINGQGADGNPIAANIRGYKEMNVLGGVRNNPDASIIGTGKGSIYNFSAGESEYALENAGQILNVESLSNVGDVINTGTISATDPAGAPQANGPYSSFVVNGNLTNGAIDADALTEWAAEKIATPGEDYREEHRTEKPAIMSIKTDLPDNVDSITNYSNMSVTGSFVNRDNGLVQATGIGSTYSIGAFDNAGVMTGIETLNINGAVGAGDSFKVAVTETRTDNGRYYDTDYNVYGRINEADLENIADGNLVNRNNGLIAGTGTGSTLNVSGNAYNLYGSTIRNFETVRIAGSLANEGVLEFINDAYIGGDFVNTHRSAAGPIQTGAGDDIILAANGDNNAIGGVMITDTYDGRVGKLTVQGDATINGGELWIGGSGEQLVVGKDYNVITVNDGHLTVNKALQVRALNEYDFDTLLGDNYPTGSSNVTRSATPRLFHAEGFYSDTEYWVSLRRDYVYGKPGITQNQKSVGTYLDQIAYTLNSASDTYTEGDLFNVLSALDNENIKGGNVPSADYGYTSGSDAGYTYASPAATQNGITEGALRALDQLSGSLYADMTMMSMQNTWLIHQNINNFLRPNPCLDACCSCGCIDGTCGCDCGNSISCTSSCVAGSDDKEVGFSLFRNAWGMAYGNTGNFDKDGIDANGFSYDSAGFIIGGDLYRSYDTRAGVYFSFGSSNLHKKNIAQQKSDIDNYQVGIYGVRDCFAGHLLGTAGIGLDNYKSERYLNFGAIDRNSNYVNRMHKGETESSQFSLHLEQSWDFCWWNTLVQPFFGVSYTHMNVDGMQEWTPWGDRADGQYVTELRNDDYQLDSMRTEIGARFSKCLYNTCRTLHLNARASWVHEYADTNATITNSFSNRNYDVETTGYGNAYNTIGNNAFNSNQYNACSYNVSSVDLGKDYLWTGVGLMWTNPNKPISIFGSYDLLANDRGKLHNGTVGVELGW